MVEKLISVSEFSRFPGGRWKKDGPFSGEEFRDTIVIPALKAAKAAGDKVVVSKWVHTQNAPAPLPLYI